MLTAKGAATRGRIVEAAADLVLERGVGGTSLDDIRAGTATSKSQLFHYFPDGKHELVRAIAAFQTERVLEAQRPYLDALDTLGVLAGLARRRRRLLRRPTALGLPDRRPRGRARRQRPRPRRRRHPAHGPLARAISRPASNGWASPDDPETLALGVFAALHGGLLLMHTMHSTAPLEAALDGALAGLRAQG